MTITELYRIIFGKSHITDGSVIDMAEHGRSGGDKDAQGFKYTSEIEETMLVDEASSTVTYIGWAKVGSDTTAGKADNIWKIRKIDTTDSNDQKVSTWADGNTSYDNVWNDRTTLTYS